MPASFKVIRHVRPKLCCAKCDQIVQAPAPSRPIERGLAGPGLLAHVLVVQVCDHLPLYRQSEIYARKASISTARRWPVGSEQRAICSALWSISCAPCTRGDASCMPTTRRCRCWRQARARRRRRGSGPMCAMIAPAADDAPPAVWFAYSPDRKGEHPQQHLASFSGVLQADGYAGFNHLYEGGTDRRSRMLGACAAQVLRHPGSATAHRSPPKPSSGSAPSMTSKAKSAASLPSPNRDPAGTSSASAR